MLYLRNFMSLKIPISKFEFVNIMRIIISGRTCPIYLQFFCTHIFCLEEIRDPDWSTQQGGGLRNEGSNPMLTSPDYLLSYLILYLIFTNINLKTGKD